MGIESKAYQYLDCMADRDEALKNIGNSLKFKYGNVNSSDFKSKCKRNDKNFIIALPCALWSGVVKTIVHLAKAIFIGIPKVIYFRKSKDLKAHIFSLIRDFQEAFGWMTTIVPYCYSYGQFNVQEANVQRFFYESSIKNKIPDFINTDQDKTLSELGDQIKTKFPPSNHSSNRLKFASIKTEEVQTAIENGYFMDSYLVSLLSEKHLKELKISKFSKKQNTFFFEKIKEVRSENARSGITNFTEIFGAYDVEEVQKAIENGALAGRKLLKKISASQARNLKFSRFNRQTLEDLFLEEKNGKLEERPLGLIDDNYGKRAYYMFSRGECDIEELKAAIQNGSFAGKNLLRLLVCNQLRQIKLRVFSKQNLLDLVAIRQITDLDFKKYEIEEVQEALESGLLSDKKLLKLLSRKQIHHLQLHKLSAQDIEDIFQFSDVNCGLNKYIFTSYPADVIQKALEADKLTQKMMKLITIKQAKGLDRQRLPYLTINLLRNINEDIDLVFSNAAHSRSSAEIQRAIASNNLSSDEIRDLYIDQIRGIKISELSKEQINTLFPKETLTNHFRRTYIAPTPSIPFSKFKHVEASEVQKAIENNLLGESLYFEISNQQLKQFNFATMSKNAVDRLFSPHLNLMTSERLFIEITNRDRLRALSADQREDLKQKLAPENIFPELFSTHENNSQSDASNDLENISVEQAYKILGVDDSSKTEQKIKSAYKLLIREYNTQFVIKTRGETDEQFEGRKQDFDKRQKQIEKAYEVLTQNRN